MHKDKALLVAFLFLFAFWYLSPMVFNWGITTSLPIIGTVFSWLPLSFLNQFSVLIGGGFTVMLYYLMTRKGEKS